ncbi:hypothetical protein JCM1841_000281 [Sporobolomyces salmonicolor]
MGSSDDPSPALAQLFQQQSAALRSDRALSPLEAEEALGTGPLLKGKVVVVTGAASGFGKAYAKQAARFGAKLVLSDLRPEAVQAVVDEIGAEGGEATGIACDVTDWDAQVRFFRHAIDTYGVVDVVAANAGVAADETDALLSAKTDSNGEPAKPRLLTADVNITGALYTVKLAFWHMDRNPAKQGKAIVILGSMASFFGIPGAPLYSMSKHAMLGLMRALYHNARANGINLTTVNPFFVQTGIFGVGPLLALAGIPLATVDDVVAAMIYATSARDVCGGAFVVDWRGILKVPYDAYAGGSRGYYKTFETRASNAIYASKIIRDLFSAISGAIWGRP